MITKTEAERIAAAINALRPDWSQAQIMGVLADERIRVQKTYADTALAMTKLALDPETRQPTRVFEHGHWWVNVQPTVSQSAHVRAMSPDDCDICSRQPEVCAFDDSHEYRRRNAPVEKLFAEKKSDTVHPDGGDAA